MIQKRFFWIQKINNIWGDVTDMPAEKYPLVATAGVSITPGSPFAWKAPNPNSDKTGERASTGNNSTKKPTYKESEAYVEKLRTLTNADGGAYSERTVQSLVAVDESLINYDLVAAVVAFIVREEKKHGPFALVQGWAGLSDAPDMCAPVLLF